MRQYAYLFLCFSLVYSYSAAFPFQKSCAAEPPPSISEKNTQLSPRGPALNDPTKETLARQYYDLNPLWRSVSNAIRLHARDMPEKQRLIFITALEKSIDKEEIRATALPIIAELYTEGELQRLIEYYEDPLIRSALAKEETFNRKVAPYITRIIDEALLRVRTEKMSPGASSSKALQEK